MNPIPICALACLCVATASAAPVTWTNGHTYDLIGNYLDHSQRWTWAESRARAEELGGHLVTIGSAEENQFLIDTFHIAAPWPAWLGFTDELTEGEWRWVTGEPVTFTGFNPGNPDNLNNEDYALMGSSWGDHHLWNDGQDSWHAAFFVEWEPRPVPEAAPFVMTMACGALLLIRRHSAAQQ